MKQLLKSKDITEATEHGKTSRRNRKLQLKYKAVTVVTVLESNSKLRKEEKKSLSLVVSDTFSKTFQLYIEFSLGKQKNKHIPKTLKWNKN